MSNWQTEADRKLAVVDSDLLAVRCRGFLRIPRENPEPTLIERKRLVLISENIYKIKVRPLTPFPRLARQRTKSHVLICRRRNNINRQVAKSGRNEPQERVVCRVTRTNRKGVTNEQRKFLCCHRSHTWA